MKAPFKCIVTLHRDIKHNFIVLSFIILKTTFDLQLNLILIETAKSDNIRQVISDNKKLLLFTKRIRSK